MRPLEEIRADFRVAAMSANSPVLYDLLTELSEFDSGEAKALRAYVELAYHEIEQNYPAAKEAAQRASALYRAVGNTGAVHGVQMRLAGLHYALGELPEALALFVPLYEDCVKRNDQREAAVAACNLGTVCENMGDYPKALYYLEIAREQFAEIGELVGQALALVGTGQVRMAIGDPVGAMECYERARTLYREAGDSMRESEATIGIGRLFMMRGEYVPALECYQHAYDLSVQIGNRRLQAEALVNIGLLYSQLRDLTHALEYYERALEINTSVGDRSSETRILTVIGKLFIDGGDLTRAEEYLCKSIALSEELEDLQSSAIALASYRTLKIKQGDYESAESLLKQLKHDQSDDHELQLMHYRHHGAIEEHKGELQQAQESLTKALSLAKDASRRSDVADIHKLLRELALKQNDFQGYVEHNTTYTQITEEINEKDAVQKLGLMEAERKIRAERQEREKERAVLYSTLPKHVADRVIRGETISDHFEQAAVFFSDIVGFTSHSSEMDAPDVVRLLETLFRSFDELCAKHGITKVKTIGDAYLCFKGDEGGSVNAGAVAAFATELQSMPHHWPNGEPLQLRVGLHIGTATAGVIGTERLQYDVWGDTVNVASRMESTSEPGRIHVSEAFANALSNAPASARAQAPSQEE
ncbi:MAG: tetratricopeptide repeat protein, partial [Bradyrhizobiaceae bacterium]|nr:tetratricopeptide repeat protein [Bradyrhizobiaceae bacterium]